MIPGNTLAFGLIGSYWTKKSASPASNPVWALNTTSIPPGGMTIPRPVVERISRMLSGGTAAATSAIAVLSNSDHHVMPIALFAIATFAPKTMFAPPSSGSRSQLMFEAEFVTCSVTRMNIPVMRT